VHRIGLTSFKDWVKDKTSDLQVLDAGSGSGLMTVILGLHLADNKRWGSTVVGLDAQEQYITSAAAKFSTLELEDYTLEKTSESSLEKTSESFSLQQLGNKLAIRLEHGNIFNATPSYDFIHLGFKVYSQFTINGEGEEASQTISLDLTLTGEGKPNQWTWIVNQLLKEGGMLAGPLALPDGKVWWCTQQKGGDIVKGAAVRYQPALPLS